MLFSEPRKPRPLSPRGDGEGARKGAAHRGRVGEGEGEGGGEELYANEFPGNGKSVV